MGVDIGIEGLQAIPKTTDDNGQVPVATVKVADRNDIVDGKTRKGVVEVGYRSTWTRGLGGVDQAQHGPAVLLVEPIVVVDKKAQGTESSVDNGHFPGASIVNLAPTR